MLEDGRGCYDMICAPVPAWNHGGAGILEPAWNRHPGSGSGEREGEYIRVDFANQLCEEEHVPKRFPETHTTRLVSVDNKVPTALALAVPTSGTARASHSSIERRPSERWSRTRGISRLSSVFSASPACVAVWKPGSLGACGIVRGASFPRTQVNCAGMHTSA